MKWDIDRYNDAIYDWLVKRFAEKRIPPSNIFRELGIERTKRGPGTPLRRAKKRGRAWKMQDICTIANYFNQNPSEILASIELHYKYFLEFPQNNKKDAAN